MTTAGVYRCLNGMVTFYSLLDTGWQLTGVAVETHQKNFRLSSGYSGDGSSEDLANDFTEKVDIPQMTAKCWTNEAKTVLKAVAVFSKHKAPFEVVVKLQNIPPVDNALNQKYLNLLDGPEGLDEGLKRAYDLLKQNLGEYPMVPVAEVTKRFSHWMICPRNGLVNLREEIKARCERHGSELF